MNPDLNQKSGWIFKLITALFCRFIINTARRFPYPFAPELSRNLNVPLTSISSIIAINQSMGFWGTFMGPLMDRIGYGMMMFFGMGLLTAGMLLVGSFPGYNMLFIGLLLSGIGKTLFDPSIQAYVGHHVPFEKRGKIVGFLELSWAASTLIGIPAVGILMHHIGWRVPFLVLGFLGMIGVFFLGWLILDDDGSKSVGSSTLGFRNILKCLVQQRPSKGILGFAFFFSVGNDHLFVIYGAWFEQSFHMSLVALGLSTMVIGTAELIGEAVTVLFADRMGLKKSVLTGTILSIFSYAMLPWFGKNVFLAFAGLFLIFLFFEFTVVSSLSLCTELIPGYRGTMMAGFFGAAGLGRVFGALMGGPVWIRFGLLGVVSVSGVSTIMAMICILWGLSHWEKPIS